MFERVRLRSALAASLGVLAGCSEQLPVEPIAYTPEILGAEEGAKVGQRGRCPRPWRDENGIIDEQEQLQAFSAGMWENQEDFEAYDRFRTAYDRACRRARYQSDI